MDVLVLLAAATLLGGLAERLRQSSLIGYLLAGTLLGPHSLGLLKNQHAVENIAELGVALLLFTIGLEFSLKRLKSLGSIVIGGGSAQVVGTLVLTALLAVIWGGSLRSGVAIGAILALSSTACVLRLLVRRAEIDSIHGRNALGILLFQDMAVVPLILIVESLGGGATVSDSALALARAVGAAVLLVCVLFGLMNFIVPSLLSKEEATRNRDLPILLAMVAAVGAATAAHAMGLSPALGAFVAGIILAESPYATQIQGDIAALRTLFVTLFFSAIGTQGDPAWVFSHILPVVGLVGAIIVGKTVIVGAVARVFRSSVPHAIATGLCLAQVGEFSFVLAKLANESGVLGEYLFNLIISATIATLFLTPYLVTWAPRIAAAFGRLTSDGRTNLSNPGDSAAQEPHTPLADHIIIVGFGPAGQRVAEALLADKYAMVVVDLNVKSIDIACGYGLKTVIGDASRSEVLEHLNIGAAKMVAVTVPDPTATRRIIALIRAVAPEVTIVVRARYHLLRWELTLAGAHVVVDEEDQVGRRMALEMRRKLRESDSDASGE